METKAVQPGNLQELRETLNLDGKKILVAGGTDVLVQLRLHPAGTVTVIDLSHMTGLKNCDQSQLGLRIGALCTMTELSISPLVREAASVLARAASRVGSTQIRNRATLGGNVVNAAQCADTIPALIALDADVELMDGQGVIRSIKVEDFVTGIGRTVLTEREVLTGFFIPARSLNLLGGYEKIGSRKTMTIAKVNGAGVFKIEAGIVSDVRTAFGSLGQRAFYSEHVSEGLKGMSLEQLRGGHAMALFVEQVEQAIPSRDSLSYKRSAVRAVAAAMLDQVLSGYGGCRHES